MGHWITQTGWRTVGGIAVGISAIMAVVGVKWEAIREPHVFFFTYWIVFLALFFVAIVCALLDFRFIRMQYAVAKREIFEQTLGEETFRRSIRKGAKDESENDASEGHSGRDS